MQAGHSIRPMNGQYFTPDELERLARTELSNFTGSPAIPTLQTLNFTSNTMTTEERDFKLGLTNPLLNFGASNSSFAIPDTSARSFSFRISNTTPNGGTAKTLNAVLFGGYRSLLASMPGLIKTGTFNDTTGSAGLSATSVETYSIEDFHAMLLREPTELLGLLFRYENNSTSQISSKLTFTKMSPFTGEEKVIQSIVPQTQQDPANPNDKILPMSLRGLGMVLDYSKKVEYPILADTSVVVTMYFGASFSVASAMEKFTKDGQSLVKLIGQSNLLAAQTAASLNG